MFRIFKVLSDKKDVHEKEPLLKKHNERISSKVPKESNVSNDFDHSGIERELSKMKPSKGNQKLEDIDSLSPSSPKKRTSPSRQGDPLQYGLYPYRESLWGYAGFEANNIPKVFLPSDDNKKTFKRR